MSAAGIKVTHGMLIDMVCDVAEGAVHLDQTKAGWSGPALKQGVVSIVLDALEKPMS